MKVLSIDPGTTNYGWAALSVKNGAVKVVRCGMFGSAITTLTENLNGPTERYFQAFGTLLHKAKADAFVAERFSARRFGTIAEQANIMLGVSCAYAVATTPDIDIQLVMPMTWKAEAKRWLGGDIKPYYKKVGKKPHPIDAVLIGLHYLKKHHGIQFPTPDEVAAGINQGYTDEFLMPT